MKIFRFVMGVCAWLGLSLLLYADPVFGEKIILEQPDGMRITGFIYGDEFYHRIETAEGYTLVLNEASGTIEYAKLAGGWLVPSGWVAGRINPAELEAKGLVRHLSDRTARIAALKETHPESLHEFGTLRQAAGPTASLPALTGTKKVFVVCVDFQAESAPPTKWSTGVHPPANFHQRIFGTDPSYVSMTNFYKAASYGQFWPEGYTYPTWVRLPQTATWYKDNGTWRGVVQDAMDGIRAQSPAFNFAQYANAGILDVIVIWAGTRETWSDFFWPKMGGVNFTRYGVFVQYYNAVNERLSDGSENSGVSTFCHEYGHMTGSPDLYDYSDFHIKPVGNYCIMGTSSTQLNFCGYIKWKVYGWVQATEIVKSGAYQIDALGAASAGHPLLYKINIETGSEYLLLENRFNGAHPFYENYPQRRNGLLITHIDENYAPAVCLPQYPFYGVEAVVPVLNPAITTLSAYSYYYDKMVFAADYGLTQIGPSYPDNQLAGAYLVLTSQEDTEHVIFRNTRGHRNNTDINITGISSSGSTMSFQVNKGYSTLSISAGPGGTTVPSPGIHVYDKGRNVDIRALENPYYVFNEWIGDTGLFSSKTPSMTLTMDEDRTLHATFNPIHEVLNLTGEKMVNRSLSQVQYINVIQWDANPANSGLNIAKYRLYLYEGLGRELLQEVSNGTFSYWDRNVDPEKTTVYGVLPVTSSGREGPPLLITVK